MHRFRSFKAAVHCTVFRLVPRKVYVALRTPYGLMEQMPDILHRNPLNLFNPNPRNRSLKPQAPSPELGKSNPAS